MSYYTVPPFRRYVLKISGALGIRQANCKVPSLRERERKTDKRTEEEEGERDREMDQINDKIMINDIKINNVLE